MNPKEAPKEIANRLMHVARMQSKGKNDLLLLLRQRAPRDYRWFEDAGLGQEQETSVGADSIEEAMRLAHKEWRENSFRTIICGFRYTLPERDEHGGNALFHQMVASYSSMNGVYYDEELGGNCIVQNASLEARRLWEKLRTEKRL